MAEREQTLFERFEEIQAERLAREQEEAATREGEAEAGTADVKAVTRQALYGDTIERRAEAAASVPTETTKRLLAAKESVPLEVIKESELTGADIAFPVPEGLGAPSEEQVTEDKAVLEEAKGRISAIEQEQEQKYQDLLNLDSDELQSEYEKLGNQYGWETAVDSATGTKYFVPPPSFANNPLLVAGARAASETARGISSSLAVALDAAGLLDEETAKELENMVPKIEDESVAVTAGSEMLSLLGGAASGYKIASSLLKNAPTAKKALGVLLGTALGEATVATEETGTLQQASGFKGAPETALENKLRIGMESLVLGATVNAAVKGGTAIAQLSPVRAIFEGLAAMVSGGKAPAEQAVSQALVDTAVRARRAEMKESGKSITGPITPEERLAAVEQMRTKLRTSFQQQTGKELDDVISGKTPMEPEDFRSTLAGLLQADEFSAIERRILGSEFKAGTLRGQEAAIARTEEQLGTREGAQEAGERAQQEIKASLEAEETTAKAAVTAPLQRQVDEAMDELDEIRKSDASLTPSGRRSKEATRLKANKFTEAATARVRKAFVDMRNAKNKAYDAYIKQAGKIEVPVDEVRNTILRAFGPEEIGNIPKRLASQNPELRGTLQQILTQQRKLDDAVADYKIANNIDAEKAIPDSVLKKLKKEVGYQDKVKLSNVETIREGVEFASSRAYKMGDTNLADATDIMKDGVNKLLNKYLRTNADAAASRSSANALNAEFKDTFFPDAGADIADMLRFGYKMTDNEMAAAATRFRTKLNGAVRGDADDIQYLQQVRSKMDEDAAARFDAEVEEALYNEVLNDVAKVDLTSKAAKADPVRTVQQLNQRLETLMSSDAFALLPKNVVTRLQERFAPVFKRADNAVDAQKALDDAAVELRKIEQEIAEDPSYALVTQMKKSTPLTIVRGILDDQNNAVTMNALWERAGTRGPKLDSGLTQAQEDLRTIFAKGLIEVAKEPGEAAIKTGKLRKVIDENEAFNVYFPADSAERKTMDMLISQIRATDVFKGATAKLSLEESVKDLSTFTDQLITYVKGPLTPEGRRLKIVSRFYFRLAGGREALENALLDTVTDPVIADRLLRETQERIQKQMLDAEEAWKLSLGSYLLGRFGIASMNDLQRDAKSFVIEQETEEALPQ